MSCANWHRHMSYSCAEQGRHVEAEYHRLEVESEELDERLARVPWWNLPLFMWLYYKAARLEARVYAAWRRTQ